VASESSANGLAASGQPDREDRARGEDAIRLLEVVREPQIGRHRIAAQRSNGEGVKAP
jgi:hypothetical protein